MNIDVLINGVKKDILNGKISSFRIIDNIGTYLDELNITIDNADYTFEVPKNKGTIEFVINNIKMGLFNIEYVDNNSSVIEIQAISQDLSLGRIKQNRVFKNNSLKDVCQTLATSLGLSLNFDSTLLSKQISYYLQDNKTDLEVLLELSEIFYSIANIKDNELVFINKEKAQSIINISEVDIISANRVDTDNKVYKGVKASYWNFKQAQNKDIILGEKPYLHIKESLEENLLKELVISKNKELNELDIINILVSGNPNLQSGFDLTINNTDIYRDFIGNYKINQVIHEFDGEFYSSQIKAFKKL